MIHTLACSITYFFEKRGLLEEKNKDICCYGLEIIISTICGMMSILLLAFLLGNFTFGMWYLLYIVPIRTCVGVYHANTYVKCNVVFVSFFICAFILFECIDSTSRAYDIIGGSNLLSSIVVFLLAPLENKNKKLNVFKKRIYRFVSTVIYSIGGILGIVLKSSYYMNILSIVLMITTALLIIGKGVDIYEKKVSE